MGLELKPGKVTPRGVTFSSFLRGVGSVLDLMPARRSLLHRFPKLRTTEEAFVADQAAIATDWAAVGLRTPETPNE